MRAVWLGAALVAGVAGLAACGASDSTAPGSTGVNGSWKFQELLGSSSLGLTCSDSATITLAQSGQTFTGNYAQTGVCSQNGQTGPNDVSGSITNGTIRGDSVFFNEDTCLYSGTTTGTPATSMGGNVDCPDSSTGQLIDITGTWLMTR